MSEFVRDDAPRSRRDAEAARRVQRERWFKARRAENQYARALRRIARMIGDLVRGVAAGATAEEILAAAAAAQQTLDRYAEILRPWAEATARRMLLDVDRRDFKAWMEHGRAIGRAMRAEILGAPTGAAYRKSLAAQVDLITSLPREAGLRVHQLATEALTGGERYGRAMTEIMRTGEVTRSRAELIARTEVARATMEFTRARAEYAGSVGYIWRTSKDGRVRPSHRRLEGTFHRWDDPPLTDPPDYHAHPGGIFNCRCWPEVVLPEHI